MKSTLTYILILVLFILFSPFIYSKNNFLKGYVITNTSDTIEGYIDFVRDENLSKLCVFKHNLNSEKIRYQPTDLIGFGILNPIKKFEVKNIGLNGRMETVFAELHLKSDMKLYSFYDKNLGFIVEMQDTTIILKIKSDVLEGTTHLIRDVNYMNQLSYIFREYFPLARNPFSIEFKVEDIKKAFLTYYKGLEKENTIDFLSQKSKDIIVKMMPKIGFSILSLEFGELILKRFSDLMLLSNEIDKDEIIKHNTVQPCLGVDFIISNPRLSGNTGLYLNQTFLMHKIMHTFQKNNSNSYEYRFKNLNSWTNIGLNYNIGMGKFSLAPFGGLFLNTYFGNTTSLIHIQKVTDNTLINTFTSKVYPDRISVGYGIGSYLSYKLFDSSSVFLKLNYNYSKGVYDSFSIKQASLGIKL
jgi:hypothetical protein